MSTKDIIWRNERSQLFNRVEVFCNKNNLLFYCNQSNFLITINSLADKLSKCLQNKIVYMSLFDIIEDQNYWKNINDICTQNGKFVFVLTDNILKFSDLTFVKFFSCPEFLGTTVTESCIPIGPITPRRLYNCFMKRIDSVRQTWFYMLYTSG